MTNKTKNVLTTKVFEPAHLLGMQLREHEAERLDLEKLVAVAFAGQAQTIYVNGEAVCIIGYYHIFPSVIELFVVPTVRMPAYALTVIRELKMFLDMLKTDPFLKVHRIQTASIADAQTDKWMRLFGFQCEGTLRQFTEDRLDYRMWSIISERGLPNG